MNNQEPFSEHPQDKEHLQNEINNLREQNRQIQQQLAETNILMGETLKKGLLRQEIAYLWKILHGNIDRQRRYPIQEVFFSYLGSFIGIWALAYLSPSIPTSSSSFPDYTLIAAPFGAAAVLVFGTPTSPLAQPRNLIVGNLLGAIISVVMVCTFGSEPLVMALAVATAIEFMQITRTLHPPGGAVALVGVMTNAKWSFIFVPVFLGSIVLLLCSYVFNNLMPGRSYPLR